MMQRLPDIRTGAFHAYFVFDVADTIDLVRVGGLAAKGFDRAPLQLRREATASSIEYETQPIVARLVDAEGTQARIKIFDYGVVSIQLAYSFSGTWADFAAFTRRLRRDDDLMREARAALDGLLPEIAAALDEPHEAIVEDFFVFEIDAFTEPVEATALLTTHASALAQLVLCEERPLTASEAAEALRVNFAYFDDDLTVVQWDTAFVYDRRDSAQAALDILEFANTQLVELRTYDKTPRRRTRHDLRARSQTPDAAFGPPRCARGRRPLTVPDRRHRRAHGPFVQRAEDHGRRLLRATLPRRVVAPWPQGLTKTNRRENRLGQRDVPLLHGPSPSGA